MSERSALRNLGAAGAISAFLAVALGAFGAHGLRDRLTTDMLEVYKTGVTYQMYHALGILLLAGMMERRPHAIGLQRAGWLFIAGTVLFSGSLYALAISGVKILGAITPLGGLCFLIGWILAAVSILKD
jgi:uncharacterized membrane protein YgdD (TMEM256/DUF423 family)